MPCRAELVRLAEDIGGKLSFHDCTILLTRKRRAPYLVGCVAEIAIGLVRCLCVRARDKGISDKFGHSNCVILRGSCKVSILPGCAMDALHSRNGSKEARCNLGPKTDRGCRE